MNPTTHEEVGVLTLAVGSPKYVACAKALARSIDLHDIGRKKAIITDSKDPTLQRLFDKVIEPLAGKKPYEHKLYLNNYSPFERTLFIDSDSVVFRPLAEANKTLAKQPFSILGDSRVKGFWYFDIAAMLNRIDRQWLPKFNSGLIYFSKDRRSEDVFTGARKVCDQYDTLPISDPYGRVADEPCFAISLAELEIPPIADDGSIMRTPIGMIGKLRANPISGHCELNSEGQIVRPAVLHYVSRTRHRDYARARFSLAIHAWSGSSSFARFAGLAGSWWWAVFRKIGIIRSW